jgi:hypothetical protein
VSGHGYQVIWVKLKRQLHPKRARTHDDAGDAHEMLAEVDNWDLRDHRQ